MKPKPRVYVTQRLPAPVVAELERSFELARDPQGAEGLVTTPADPVDAELLDTVGSQLRLVANFAVGYDNVDLDAAVRRGIVVTNTPDVLTRAVAEFTVAAVLALLRRVVEGDRFVRSGRPWSWATTFMLGTGVDGKSLGCVGFGRIGRETARLARCLGMEVAYTNGSGALPGVDAQWLPLRELLGVADVVSIHCPLTPETRHLIGRDELAAMQPAAVLVNTSRGPIVDERALAAALADGERLSIDEAVELALDAPESA